MGQSFVIRLANAARRVGKLAGEVEEVSTRRVARFRDADELVAFLQPDPADGSAGADDLKEEQQ